MVLVSNNTIDLFILTSVHLSLETWLFEKDEEEKEG